MAIIFPRAGNLLTGMKIPLIKTRGKRTILENIIMLEGLSVAGAENKIPKQEKQNPERIIVPSRTAILFNPINKKGMAKTERVKVIATPKRKPARISPKRINSREIGQLTNLSRVCVLVSQGVIIGPTEEEVKKSARTITIGNKELKGIFLPRKKAKKRKPGKIKP